MTLTKPGLVIYDGQVHSKIQPFSTTSNRLSEL